MLITSRLLEKWSRGKPKGHCAEKSLSAEITHDLPLAVSKIREKIALTFFSAYLPRKSDTPQGGVAS